MQMGKIEKIRFTSNGATAESYSRFITNLLNVLTENADRRSSVPILPTLSKTNHKSYVHVEISNGRSQTLTLAIYITNSYVVGYQNNANSIAYFFKSHKDSEVQKAAFPNAARRELLHFDGNYDSLGDRNVPLGSSELTNAISTLYKYPSGSDNRQMRRAFLVVIQMTSEAARFKNLRREIFKTFPNGRPYTPDSLMQEYETSWGQISCAVQNANPNGNFQNPVIITYRTSNNDFQRLVLQKVSDVIHIVGILVRDINSLR